MTSTSPTSCAVGPTPPGPTSCEVVVIPKGFAEPGRLRFTLALTPHPDMPVGTINLTACVRALTSVRLQGRDGQGACSPYVDVPLGDQLRSLLDPNLWDVVFGKVKGATSSQRLVSTATPAAFASAQVVRSLHLHAYALLDEMRGQSMHGVDPSKIDYNARKRGGVRVSSLRRRANASATAEDTGALSALLSGALDDVDELIRPPGDHVDDLVDDLCRGPMSDVQIMDAAVESDRKKEISRLLAAQPVRDAPRASPAQKQDDYLLDPFWQQLHALGIRYRDTAVGSLFDRIDAVRGPGRLLALSQGGGSDSMSLIEVILDTMLLKATHVPDSPAITRAHQEGSANNLAAVGLEFGLHPLLGLAIDLQVDIAGTPLEGILRVKDPRLSAYIESPSAVDTLTFVPAWTATSAAGLLRRRDPTTPPDPLADTIRFREDGWCELNGGLLANSELSNTTNDWFSALLDTRNKSDVAVRGAVGASANLSIPRLHTGPVVLHVDGLSAWRMQEYGRSQDTANSPPVDPCYYLEDLVIGVRPRLRVQRSQGSQPVSADLLARDVRYGTHVVDEQKQTAAQKLDPSRVEGVVHLHRATSPGQGSGDDSTLTMDDQLFEWNGWNTAVPMPGVAADKRDLLCKRIAASRRASVPYRYGTLVKAACRWVLRDGSSPDSDETLAPWVTAAEVPGGSCSGGLPLRRYEPIKSPQAMFENLHVGGALQSSQAPTKIVLGGLRDKPSIAERAVRCIIPGALRDVIELARHGVFDDGTHPTASAYRGFDRVRGQQPDGQVFPSEKDTAGCEQPLFRRGSSLEAVPVSLSYHPDPLATRLQGTIVRRTRTGDWRTVHDASGNPIELAVELYGEGRRWPDAAAWRLAFAARRRHDSRAATTRLADDGILRSVEIAVPEGERFSVLIVGAGEAAVLCRQHAIAAAAAQDQAQLCRDLDANDTVDLNPDSPLLAEALVIDVMHAVERPFDPKIVACHPRPRPLNDPACALTITFEADAGSTLQLDLHASWTDPLDDPIRGRPRAAMDSGAPRSAMIVQPLTSAFDDQVDRQLLGMATNRLLRPAVRVEGLQLVHRFNDTKRRSVHYRLRATGDTLLQTHKLLPGSAQTHTDSADIEPLDIRASSPPAVPRVREVLPSFRFARREELLLSESIRDCALTVILERGWWSSGPGELLAVIVTPGRRDGPGSLPLPQASQWGADPLRRSNVQPVDPWIRASDFLPSEQRREASELIDLGSDEAVFYEPRYDPGLDAWCVDLLLDARGLAQPFVQLVLARFQPHAVPKAQCSGRVVVDFIQLPSKRTATIRVDAGTEQMHVVVSGPVGVGSEEAGQVKLSAHLQHRVAAGMGKSTWTDTPVCRELVASPGQDRFEASLPLELPWRLGVVRIRIEERTYFKVDDSLGPVQKTCGPMHYFDALDLDLLEWPHSPN